MIEIECLQCNAKLDIPEWLDTKNYNGEIRCKKCGARLATKFVDSKLVKYKVVLKGKPRNVKLNVRFVDKKRNDNLRL